jgi:hypothetical protein
MDRYQQRGIVEAAILNYFDGACAVLEGGERIDLSEADYERIEKMARGVWVTPIARSSDLKSSGGYIVRYEDGYLSWCPKKAFEDGYRRI